MTKSLPLATSGVARMVLATACLSLLFVLVKSIAARIPIIEILLLRTLLPLPLLVWLVRRRRLPLAPNNWPLVAFRAVTGMTAMYLAFFALGKLPLADASLIAKAQPVIIVLLAPLVLRERPSPWILLSLLLAGTGVFLILRPSLAIGNLGGVAMLGCACFSAAAHMTLRRLSADDDPRVIVLGYTFAITVVAAPVTFALGVMPTWAELAALCGIAALGTAGQLLMTAAYAVESASAASTASYASVLFAVLWGWVFWGDLPTSVGWAGGGLVVLSGILLLWTRAGIAPTAYIRT